MNKRIIILFLLLCCSAVAQKKDAIGASPFKASVVPYTTNGNGQISPGETIKLMFCIQNVTTNTFILSKKSYVNFEWSPEPLHIISESINAAGGVTQTTGPGGGGGTEWIGTAGIDYFIPSGDEYTFLRPGHALHFEERFSVPSDYALHSFTSITYRASVIAKDDGRIYGLNAWTGIIDMTGFKIELTQIQRKTGQPTNAPYSSPAAGSKR